MMLHFDEHGGMFVMKAAGLDVQQQDSEADAGVHLIIVWENSGDVKQAIQAFAARHSLRLTPGPYAPAPAEQPVLAACHLPSHQRFVFCEEPQIRLALAGPGAASLAIKVAFKSRPATCQEADLVVHLKPAAMARLLEGVLHLLG